MSSLIVASLDPSNMVCYRHFQLRLNIAQRTFDTLQRLTMKKLVIALAVTTALTGCLSKEVKCGDESAASLVHELITDAASKGMKDEKFDDGTPMFESAKISAYLSQIKSKLTAVRTEKNDPDSNKNFCAAEVSFTIPTTLLNDGDALRKEMNQSTSDQMADLLKIKKEANVASMEITYSVQPTDSGEEVFVHLDNPDTMGKFLQFVTTSVLIKPIIEKQRAEAVAQQQKMKAEQAKAQAGQQCVDNKVNAYHAEMGDDAMITNDQLQEWEGECKAM